MFSYIKKLKGKSKPPKTYYDRNRDTREGTGMTAGLSSRYLVWRLVDPVGKDRVVGWLERVAPEHTDRHIWSRQRGKLLRCREPGPCSVPARGAGWGSHMLNSGGSCCDAGRPARTLCQPEERDGAGGGREAQEGGARACLRLIPIAVGQKPTPHKPVTLQ